MPSPNFIEEEWEKMYADCDKFQQNAGEIGLGDIADIHIERVHSLLSALKSEVEGMKKEGSLTCRACGTGLLGPAYGMGKVSFELQCKVCGNYQEENEDVKEYNSALQQVINLIEKYEK